MKNIFDNAFIENPYSSYEYLLKDDLITKSPVFGGAWLVARYSQVNNLFLDERFTNSTLHYLFNQFTPEQQQSLKAFKELHYNLLPYMRDEQHTEMRKVMHRALQLSSKIYYQTLFEHAKSCIEPYKLTDKLDFVSTIALPFPAEVLCVILGIDVVNRDLLIKHALTYKNYISNPAFTFEGALQAQEAVFAIRQFFVDAIEKKTIIENSILDSFLKAKLLHQFVILVLGGYVNTHNLLGNAMLALLTYPKQMQLLLSRQVSYLDALRELFRFDTSFQITPRMALEDVELEGVTIKKNDLVLLLVGAANRDSRVFENPNELNLTRKHNPHLTFGAGMHTCVGLQLTYLTAELALRTVFDQLNNISKTNTDVNRIQSFIFRGIQHLEISFSSANRR